MNGALRHWMVVLGEQLDAEASALDGFDVHRDVLWMAEVAEESEHVWTGKPRIAPFLSAMRHFRDSQPQLGRRVHYVELDQTGNTQTLAGELLRAVTALKPERILMTEAGEWRFQEAMTTAGCRLDPATAEGEDACPFTTLYWDFLLRHEELLAKNPRMALQVRNLGRLKAADRAAIHSRTLEIRAHGGAPPARAKPPAHLGKPSRRAST